ncbi:MAG: response regulator [Methanoregula sp.]
MTDRTRILIVEDETIVAEDLKEVLERNNYTVTGNVASGREAIEAVQAGKPDLILMDINLNGDIDGIETTKRIHEDADIPVIYLTSYTSGDYIENAKKTGPYGYIAKPFDPQTVITTIEIALGKHAIDMRARANLETYRFIADYTSSWEMWYDTDGIPLFISPSSERITGYTPAELMEKPDLFLDMVLPDDRELFHAHALEESKSASQDLSIRYRILTRSGDTRWIQHSCTPIHDRNGTFKGRRISNIDITREQEQINTITVAIEESNERYFSLAETMKDTCVFVYDVRKGIEYINTKGAALFKKEPGDLLKKPISALSGVDGVRNIITTIEHFIRTGSPAVFEGSLVPSPGNEVFLEVRLFTLKTGQQEPGKIWAIIQDVTEKKLAGQKILESLREKEILLKEIHHRVKNNLQQIASLLYLQEIRGNNQDPGTTLRESRNRVYSMSLAHEILYSSDDLANVDLATYFSRLTGYLRTTFGLESGSVTIITDIEPGLSLPLDDCITCGIIANELISNAMKYAFDKKSGGEISIAFHCSGPGCIMEVSDTGCGLPASVNLDAPATLGLSLVTSLVRQMEGTIDLSRENGTRFTIMFPKRENGT